MARGAVLIRRNGLEKAFLDVRNTYDIAPVANRETNVPTEVRLEDAVLAAIRIKRGFFADVFLGETRLGVFGVKAVDRVRTPTDEPDGGEVGARAAGVDDVDSTRSLLRILRVEARCKAHNLLGVLRGVAVDESALKRLGHGLDERAFFGSAPRFLHAVDFGELLIDRGEGLKHAAGVRDLGDRGLGLLHTIVELAPRDGRKTRADGRAVGELVVRLHPRDVVHHFIGFVENFNDVSELAIRIQTIHHVGERRIAIRLSSRSHSLSPYSSTTMLDFG